MINCFEPIIDNKSKILILGSMPSVESLNRQEYYAFKRNQFWKILHNLFKKELDESYEDKVKFLLKHNIALWDVLKVCERKGSLDSDIRNEETNDFDKLFKDFPNIEHVIFNGAKAYNSFKKHIGFNIKAGIKYYKLPSTSPAYTKKFQLKFEEWKIIKDIISQ